MNEQLPQTLEVPLSSLAELAVECWRLERWAGSFGPDAPVSPARHVARRLSKFLAARDVSVLDLTGRGYEPGLAVEVLDVVRDARTPPGIEVVEEMLSPIVLWRGTVVRHGQVIVRKK
ncbi:MAG TPA: hypothetical protein VFS10_22555 [Pyrinomonadaceae bacterium]|nr:hypothetical protein [Pyrinomonadaceae bacterium]